MAVPPTPDGPVGRSRALTFTLASAAFGVVIVVCAVLLVVRYLNDTEGDATDRVGQLLGEAPAPSTDAPPDDAETRELVMSQANQFVLRVNSYGPGDLDEQNAMPEYAERVREVITPKLAVSFDESVTLAEQTVAGAGYARTTQLFATGLESLDDNAASVLVAGSFTSSYPDSAAAGRVELEPLTFRFRVELVQVEGEWLVDDQTALTGEKESPGLAPGAPDPGQEPSQTPSPPPSPDGGR